MQRRAMSFMSWNYELTQKLYPSTAAGFLNRIDGRTNLNPPVVSNKIKDLEKDEGADPNSPSTLARAREMTAGQPPSHMKYLSPAFGYSCQWTSEYGSSDDLDAILRQADKFLNPSWSNGGLYYPRQDKGWDEQGNFTAVDAYTGNAGIAYARLNVKNGQKKMWDHPWTREEVNSKPFVEGVSLSQAIDCLRGTWDEREQAMVLTLRTWNGTSKDIDLKAQNLPPGQYGVYVNGELLQSTEVTKLTDAIPVSFIVGGEEVDIVLVRL